MQFELISHAESEASSVPVSSISQQTTANVGEQFKVLLDGYCTAIDAYLEALTGLDAVEESIPCKEYISAIEKPSEYDVQKWKMKAGERIVRRLIVHAKQLFAPGGAGLEIDEDPIFKRFPIDRHGNLSTFDPAAIWKHLEETYGGDAGEKHAWAQAAATIFKELSLQRADKVERKGEYLVINNQTWSQKKFNGSMELSTHTADRMRKLFEALVAFASWADKPVLRADLYQFRMKNLAGYAPDVVSRQRFGFGVSSLDMVLITFNTSWEFRFRQPVAEKLQLFLATYHVADEY